jgi:hypothetical protein
MTFPHGDLDYFQVHLFTIYGKLTNKTVFHVFDKTGKKAKV